MNIIPIKPNSIKKNSGAGNFHKDIEHGTFLKIESYFDLTKEIPELQFDSININYPQDSLDAIAPEEKIYQYTLYTYSKEQIDKFRKNEKINLVSECKEIQRIWFNTPIPEYSCQYDYDVIVKCDNCNFKFKFSDSFLDYKGDEICPKCCAEIIYEIEKLENE